MDKKRIGVVAAITTVLVVAIGVYSPTATAPDRTDTVSTHDQPDSVALEQSIHLGSDAMPATQASAAQIRLHPCPKKRNSPQQPQKQAADRKTWRHP
jgi:hypothetical protein